MNKLLILRHGPTPWNADKRLQGRTDIALDKLGRAVVKNWRIPSEFMAFQAVTSPLKRAMETAALLGLHANVDPALTEMCWGDWEGKNLAELRARLGDEMRHNEAQGLDFRPPNGESPRDIQRRLVPWLENLNQSTIVVAHRGIIRALYARASNWDMRSKPPHRMDKFAAHLFVVDAGHVQIERLNIPLEAT